MAEDTASLQAVTLQEWEGGLDPAVAHRLQLEAPVQWPGGPSLTGGGRGLALQRGPASQDSWAKSGLLWCGGLEQGAAWGLAGWCLRCGSGRHVSFWLTKSRCLAC